MGCCLLLRPAPAGPLAAPPGPLMPSPSSYSRSASCTSSSFLVWRRARVIAGPRWPEQGQYFGLAVHTRTGRQLTGRLTSRANGAQWPPGEGHGNLEFLRRSHGCLGGNLLFRVTGLHMASPIDVQGTVLQSIQLRKVPQLRTRLRLGPPPITGPTSGFIPQQTDTVEPGHHPCPPPLLRHRATILTS